VGLHSTPIIGEELTWVNGFPASGRNRALNGAVKMARGKPALSAVAVGYSANSLLLRRR
jgi:hypothetical protein